MGIHSNTCFFLQIYFGETFFVKGSLTYISIYIYISTSAFSHNFWDLIHQVITYFQMKNYQRWPYKLRSIRGLWLPAIGAWHRICPFCLFKGQWGVPLTVYPWHLLCFLGILGDYNPYIPLYRAYFGVSHRGTLVGVHPTIPWFVGLERKTIIDMTT